MKTIEVRQNLTDELSRHATSRPNDIAVFHQEGAINFRSLDLMIWRMATRLKEAGVKPGDVLVHTFEREVLLLVAMLATARLGATAFSIPHSTPLLRRQEMIRSIGSSVRWLATDIRNSHDTGIGKIEFQLRDIDDENLPIDITVRDEAPEYPWLIVSGSGSTGKEKLFAVTHACFLKRMELHVGLMPLHAGDRIAVLLHLDFTSAKMNSLIALLSGATLCFYDRAQVQPLQVCKKYGVTVMYATVLHLEQFLSSLPGPGGQQSLSLRALVVSASTVSDHLRHRCLAALGHCLVVRYSTNESGYLSSTETNDELSVKGTVGRPLHGVTLQIVDAHDKVLPVGHAGQIRVKTPGMTSAYLDDPEASAKAFRDGWFYPGDIGRLTEDGQLVFLGRADHMMIRDGINIYPAEIEMAMCRHPSVRDAAAVPFLHSIHQEIPVCGVALAEGAVASESELLAHARERLGAHAPMRIAVLESIPRNEQGKLVRDVFKRQLERVFSQGQEKGDDSQKVFKQPVTVVDMVLSVPETIAWKELDEGLQVAMGFAAPSLLQSGSDVEARAFLERVLLLAGSFLRVVNVPAFDHGRVLSLKKEPEAGHWVAKVAMPHIDLMSPQATRQALEGAIQVVTRLASGAVDRQQWAAIFDEVSLKVLQPLSGILPPGKSTVPVLRVAYQKNIPFFHLGAGIYQLGWGSRSRRMDRSTTDWDSAHGLKLSQNKSWTANLLRMAGLPAPVHEVTYSLEQARAAARRLGGPLVIKPTDCERGEGVTVSVRNEEQLDQAFHEALSRSPAKQVLVEREAAGVCHRLFIAQGRLLYAVKRLPKSIFGDGTLSVAELVRKANEVELRKAPWLRGEEYPLDAAALAAMHAAGFGPDSVPGRGVRVPLRNIESTRWGGFDENVTDAIHPDNLDVALRAAELFTLDVVGIDIISADIRRPWHENGAIINEVNFAPLFGGGEISRQHIPVFFDRFIKGDGRIPIEVVVGAEHAMEMAIARQKELLAQGLRCVVSSHRLTLGYDGKLMPLPFSGAGGRCKALLLNRKVDAVILVLQTNEVLHSGLPVDRITRLIDGGGELHSWQRENERLNDSERQLLLGTLSKYCQT